MDEERAGRLVAALRARGVMAHTAHLGVYQFGIQVVLMEGGEAVWDTDESLGLRAEVVEDGVLVGFVPQIPGSEGFTDEQLVEAVAATRYDKEGLHPPTDTPPGGRPRVRPPGPAPSPPRPSSPRDSPPPPGRRGSRFPRWPGHRS
ncbi:hypothetical protein [Streptomyces sp. NPDC095613]|uniref:hypothetical protein n=1 Tax=Streptomyces sp. NPDC095613 TaxID=3155540 RepID=UPI003327C520